MRANRGHGPLPKEQAAGWVGPPGREPITSTIRLPAYNSFAPLLSRREASRSASRVGSGSR